VDSGLLLVTRPNENLNSQRKHDLTNQMTNSAIISLGWEQSSTALAHFEYNTSSRCPLLPVIKGDWGRT